MGNSGVYTHITEVYYCIDRIIWIDSCMDALASVTCNRNTEISIIHLKATLRQQVVDISGWHCANGLVQRLLMREVLGMYRHS